MLQIPNPTESSSAVAEIGAIPQLGGKPPRRRRWSQFSLRAFLAVLTLSGVCFGWLRIQFDHARRQRAAIEALNSTQVRYSYEPITIDREYNSWPAWKDAPPPAPAFVRRVCGENIFADAVSLKAYALNPSDLAQLGSLQTLEWLSLTAPGDQRDFTDADLVHIRDLTRLKGLKICRSAVTDAGLRHLAGLVELEVLELSHVRISGTGLSYLSRCARLQDLNLAGTSITGAGLRHLRGIANLETLSLDHTHVSGDGLEVLSTLPALTSLSLSDTPISDADLCHIARLTNITVLDLSGTLITDEGLAQLSTLGELEALYLDHANISDAGIMHLHRLKNLERVAIRSTDVTNQGVEQLRLALPNAEVVD